MSKPTEIKTLGELKLPDLAELAPKSSDTPPVKPDVADDIPTDIKGGDTQVIDNNTPDDDVIETDIFSAEPPKPAKKKTDAEFAEERRQAKLAKAAKDLGVDGLKSELDQTKVTLLNYEAEKEKLTREKTEYEEKVKIYESRLKEKEQLLAERENSYYDDFKPQVDLTTDDELLGSRSAVASAFSQYAPDRIQTASGVQRFLPEKLFNDPAKEGHVDHIMSYFIQAKANGDDAVMDTAVNAMAQLMGADIVLSADPQERQVLPNTDQTFIAIERAMKAAVDPHLKKVQRKAYLTEQAPKVVAEQIEKRESIIREGMMKSVVLSPEKRMERLRANPIDSAGLVSALIEANPHLQELVEQHVHGVAPAFARMGKINVPISDKSPEGLARHRQEVARYQGLVQETSSAAVIGKIAGPVIAQLMSQVKALSERVGKIGEATNPGGGAGGEGKDPEPSIETSI
jgi:hypothetical protein